MPKHRKLRFATLDEVAADIQRLRSGPYEKGGAWNLSQACEHLANTLRVGLHGGLEPMFPWLLRATVFRVMFELVIACEWMPSGATAPPEILPADANEDDPAKIDECLRLLAEARDRTAPIPPSPFVTGLTLPKWKKLQRVHCAHHLAFLRPTTDA